MVSASRVSGQPSPSLFSDFLLLSLPFPSRTLLVTGPTSAFALAQVVPLNTLLLDVVVWSFTLFTSAVAPAPCVSQHEHPNVHALAQVSTTQDHRWFTICMVAERRIWPAALCRISRSTQPPAHRSPHQETMAALTAQARKLALWVGDLQQRLAARQQRQPQQQVLHGEESQD